METEAVASLYRGITKASLENAVDTMRLNILNMYFHPKDGFVLHPQIPLSAASSRRGNIAVARVNTVGHQELVILCENERAEFEGRNAEWKEALEQLTSYLNIVRSGFKPDMEHTLYG